MAALAANMGAMLFAPADSLPVGATALLLLLTNIVAVVLTGMWIYRVNANAHTFADGLTTTPGWAVGWFFIPIANLWKPFEAMREVWRASSTGADWATAAIPALFGWWWGCWIGGNVLASASYQTDRLTHDASAVYALDIASSALLLVGAGLLVRIIVAVSALQPRAHAAITFS